MNVQVRELVQSGQHDVYINLCDGSYEEDRAGIEVVQALERCGGHVLLRCWL